MSEIETVKVTYTGSPDGGLVIINKSDFDPDLHTLEGEEKPKKRGRPRKNTEAK